MADATKRMSYFDRQFLRAADFQDEQAYDIDRRRRHNRLLHSPGIGEGLQVTGAAGDGSVAVSAGTAYDGMGQEIVLATSQQVDISAITGTAVTAFITISYGEQGSDPSTDPGVTGTSTRISETPGLAASATAPANPNINLVLATVSVTDGKLDAPPDNTARTSAGTILPTDLALRSLTLDSDTVPSNQWPKLVCDHANSAGLQNAGLVVDRGLILKSGKVGVGTTTPDRTVTIEQPAAAYLNLRDKGDTGGPFEVLVGADGNGGIVSTMTNHDLQLRCGGNQTKVILKASGNVGIGTITPRSSLEIQATAPAALGPAITLTNLGGNNGAASAVDFNTYTPATTGTYNPSFRVQAVDDGGFTNDLVFLCNKSGAANSGMVERIRVTSGFGNSGLSMDITDRIRLRQGTSSSAGIWLFQTTPNLDRAFMGMASDTQVGLWGNTGAGWGLVMDTTTGNTGIGISANLPAAKLDVGGPMHATTFLASSDERFKKNVKPLTNVLQKINKIRGVTFEWNEVYESMGRSTGRREIGVIAQEVEPQFPELVTLWGEGSENRAVDYGRLSAVLLQAVKELKAENDDLRARIEKCEEKLGVAAKKKTARSTKAEKTETDASNG